MRLKKCLIYVLTFLLLCNAVLLGEWQDAYVAHANNDSTTNNTTIIRDGDFEASTGASASNVQPGVKGGTIEGSEWGYYHSTGASAVAINYEVTAEVGRTGNAMKIHPDASVASTAIGKGVVRQTGIKGLEAGKTYLLAVYAKAENLNANAAITFKLDNGGTAVRQNGTFNAGTCSDWTQMTAVFTAGTSYTDGDGLEIHMSNITQNGYWLLDDISIVEIVPTINVNPTELSLEVGGIANIMATLDDEYKVLGEEPVLEWSSSDANVVSVDQNGKVTAVGAGQATVTVKASDDVTAECKVTVTEKADDSTAVLIRNGDFEAPAGELATNIGVGVGGGTIGTTEWRYHHSSSGTKVPMNYEVTEEVGRTGKALKISPDTSVSADAIGKGLILQGEITGLKAGQKYVITLYAKAVDLNDDAQIKFILANGTEKVRSDAVKANTCGEWTKVTKEFTAVTPGASGDGIEIHLDSIKQNGYWLLDDISITRVPTFAIDKTELNLEVGDSAEIVITLDDPHKVLGENPVFVWNNSDGAVVTMTAENEKAAITAKDIGKAVITVKSEDGSVGAECEVNVTAKKIISNGDFALGTEGWTTGTNVVAVADGRSNNALQITADDGFAQNVDEKISTNLLATGSKYLVTVYAKPVGTNSDSAVTVSWYDSETANAVTSEIKADAVGDSDGWIKIIKEFTAGDMSAAGTKLAVQVSNLTSGYWLFDDISIRRMPSVSLTPAEMNIIVGEKAEIDATMIDPDYILDKAPAFNYSSADESIAKVDLRGRVTGISAGTTTITVTNAYYPEYSANCTVHVSAIDLTSISLPESLNLCEAEQQMLTVTFTPANATNQAITWSSSDGEVVVVDENGLVTGMKAGTATITATGANNLTATCTVTVRKSTTLLTEEAKIKSTTYQEVVNSFVEFVTNNTGAEATYSLYEAPEKGILKVNEDGSFSYIPRNGQVGDSETFTVIVNAGTEYAFIKGNIELVEAIVDSDDDTDSDSNLDSDSDTDSDSDIDSDSDSDTGSDTDSDSDSDTGNDTDNDIDSDSSSDATGESSSDTDSNTSGDSSAGDNEPNEAAGDTANSTKVAEVTKTGDNSNMGLWLLLLAIAVVALGGAGCVFYRKKL